MGIMIKADLLEIGVVTQAAIIPTKKTVRNF
jgi:hypothetical protein